MRILLALLVSIALTGCFGTTKIVTRTVTIYQEVPAELTVKVKPTPPLDKVIYLAMPIYERERYLADYTVKTLESLYTCNVQLDSISVLSRKWKENSRENKP